MINPLRASPESYARALAADSLRLAKPGFAEAVARRVEIEAEAIMAQAIEAGDTRLSSAGAFWSDGHLCLMAKADTGQGQSQVARAFISFSESRAQRTLSRAKSLAMGRRRLCSHLASRLADAMAKKEAAMLRAANFSLPDAPPGAPASRYRRAVEAERSRLERLDLESTLCGDVVIALSHLMDRARRAGFSNFDRLEQSVSTRDCIKATASRVSTPEYFATVHAALRLSWSVQGGMLLLCKSRILPQVIYCPWLAARLFRALARKEAELIHRLKAEQPPGIVAQAEKAQIASAAMPASLASSPNGSRPPRI